MCVVCFGCWCVCCLHVRWLVLLPACLLPVCSLPGGCLLPLSASTLLFVCFTRAYVYPASTCTSRACLSYACVSICISLAFTDVFLSFHFRQQVLESCCDLVSSFDRIFTQLLIPALSIQKKSFFLLFFCFLGGCFIFCSHRAISRILPKRLHIILAK